MLLLGDDALALWSEHNRDKNNVLKFNTIALPILANGMRVAIAELIFLNFIK